MVSGDFWINSGVHIMSEHLECFSLFEILILVTRFHLRSPLKNFQTKILATFKIEIFLNRQSQPLTVSGLAQRSIHEFNSVSTTLKKTVNPTYLITRMPLLNKANIHFIYYWSQK